MSRRSPVTLVAHRRRANYPATTSPARHSERCRELRAHGHPEAIYGRCVPNHRFSRPTPRGQPSPRVSAPVAAQVGERRSSSTSCGCRSSPKGGSAPRRAEPGWWRRKAPRGAAVAGGPPGGPGKRCRRRLGRGAVRPPLRETWRAAADPRDGDRRFSHVRAARSAQALATVTRMGRDRRRARFARRAK